MKHTPTIRLCVAKPLTISSFDEKLEDFKPYHETVGVIESINFKKRTIRVRYKVPGSRAKTITLTDTAFWQKYKLLNCDYNE